MSERQADAAGRLVVRPREVALPFVAPMAPLAGWNGAVYGKTENGLVFITGSGWTTNAIGVGEVLANVPVGYRPANQVIGAMSPTSGRVDVNPAGQVLAQFALGAGGTLVTFHFLYPPA